MFNLFSLINTWASLAKVANSTGLTDKVVNTPIVKQAVEKVSPVVSPIVKPISDAVQWANTFYQDNVVKPIVRDQKWKQEREKIVAPYRDVFSQYSMDDIKEFWLTPDEENEVLSTLSEYWLKVNGMDEYLAKKEQDRMEQERIRAMQEQNTNWLLPWVDPNFQFHETIPWSDWIKENMTWKSDPTDGVSASLGKAAVNLPWNALGAWIWLFNLGSTAVQEWVYDTLAWGIVNPAVKAWGQFIDETAKDYSQNGVLDGTFNLVNKARKFAVENPLDTAMILRPKATGEMIGKAGKTILKPVSENIVKPITTPIVNAGKNIVKAWERYTWDLKTKAQSMATGIDASTQKWIQSNPYLKDYWAETKQRIDSEWGVIDPKVLQTEFTGKVADELQANINTKKVELSEDWPVYEAIRESWQSIEFEPLLSNIQTTLKENGLKYTKNWGVSKIEWLKSAEINSADLTKITELIRALESEAKMNEWRLTASHLLDARKVASNLAKYDANTTTSGIKVIRSIRSNIDAIAKENINGLKEIDKNYADKLEEIYNLEDGLIYKQGDKKWQFKDNFDSYIKNINNDAKSAMRERLQEVMPDLSLRIEAINKLPSIYKTYTTWSPLVGAGVKIAWTLIGSSVWPIWWIIWYLLGEWIARALTKVQQAWINRILSELSPDWQAQLLKINSKIEKNILLTQKERAFVQKIKSDVEDKVWLSPEKKTTSESSKKQSIVKPAQKTPQQEKTIVKQP